MENLNRTESIGNYSSEYLIECEARDFLRHDRGWQEEQALGIKKHRGAAGWAALRRVIILEREKEKNG